VEAEAVKIVGKAKTKLTWSWDIRGLNVRLNRVFELNGMRYGQYPEGGSTDVGDDREKKVKTWADEGSSKGKIVIVAEKENRGERYDEGIGGMKALRCFVE
jgi:hypothetical protein